jgi:hypothetical protein
MSTMLEKFGCLLENARKIAKSLNVAGHRHEGLCRSRRRQMSSKVVVSPVYVEESQLIESSHVTKVSVTSARQPAETGRDLEYPITMGHKFVNHHFHAYAQASLAYNLSLFEPVAMLVNVHYLRD